MKPKTRKYLSIFLIGMCTGIGGLLGFQTVFAASVYNVTETTGTVGVSTTFEVQYTVDTAVQTWVNNDTLTLQLPANMTAFAPTFSLEYDTDTVNNGVGEIPITPGIARGQFSYSNPTLTVKWSLADWGAPINGASTIRILVTATPTFENAASTFVFGGSTAAGGDTDPTASDTVNAAAADANAAVLLGANSVVGQSGATTLNFYLAAKMTANDTIVFTAPMNLSVSGITYVSKTFGGAGTFVCNAVGQLVTCTADGIVNIGVGDLVFSGVISRYTASTMSISGFSVNDSDQAGAHISADASGAVTDTVPGVLTQTSLTHSSSLYGTTVTSTATFTTGMVIPQGGKIAIGLPLGWTIAGVDTHTAYALSGLDGTWTASVAGQLLIFTQTGGGITSPGLKSMTFDGLRTPDSPGLSTDYSILTKTPLGANIEVDPMIFGMVISGSNGGSHQILQAPTNIAVTDGITGGVLISWTDPTDSSRFIDILKGEGTYPVNGVPFIRVPVGVQSYLDMHVTVGQTVRYVLRSGNDRDGGTISAEVSFVVGSTIPSVSTSTGTPNSTGTVTETTDSTVSDTSTQTQEVDTTVESSDETAVEVPTETPTESVEVITFADTENHWASGYISALAASGVVYGNPDGDFRPDLALNRAETAALLYRELFAEDATTTEVQHFSDVTPDAWYAGYVDALYEQGLFDSTLENYAPSGLISTQDFLDLALKVYTLKGGVNADALLEPTICSAQVCQRAELPITRAQAAEILYALFVQH